MGLGHPIPSPLAIAIATALPRSLALGAASGGEAEQVIEPFAVGTLSFATTSLDVYMLAVGGLEYMPRMLADAGLAGVTVREDATGGYTVAQVRASMATLIPAMSGLTNPVIVFNGILANDCNNAKSTYGRCDAAPSSFWEARMADVQWINDQCAAAGIKTLWGNISFINYDLNDSVRADEDIGSAYVNREWLEPWIAANHPDQYDIAAGRAMIDFYTATWNAADWAFEDYIHPNTIGRQFWRRVNVDRIAKMAQGIIPAPIQKLAWPIVPANYSQAPFITAFGNATSAAALPSAFNSFRASGGGANVVPPATVKDLSGNVIPGAFVRLYGQQNGVSAGRGNSGDVSLTLTNDKLLKGNCYNNNTIFVEIGGLAPNAAVTVKFNASYQFTATVNDWKGNVAANTATTQEHVNDEALPSGFLTFTTRTDPFGSIHIATTRTQDAGGQYSSVSGIEVAGRVLASASPTTSGAIDLGQLTVGAAEEITSAQLLAGATDPDGDPLTVEALAVTTGSATLTGTGPWSLTPTAAGPIVLSYTISDGLGGSVGQVAQAVAVAADDYTRRHDYLGLYRARANSFVSWWTLPALTYTANTDAMDYYIGVRVESDEPASAGTVEDNVLTRGSSSFRNRIWRLADGTVRINSLNNVTLTISDPGAWPLNEICRFWIRDFASQILLYKMDSNGDYQLLKTTAKTTFDIFSPLYLMGNAIKYHGACYYAAAVVNGSTVYDFRFDEMTGAVARSAHNSAVTAAYTAGAGGPIVWNDDTPPGLYPVPDFAVSGSKTHGSTISITTATLTFAGGMPQYQLYDDGVGKSGQVGAAATIGTWAQISNPSALQQYRTTGGPNNKPFFVWIDGATGERLARIADPGFAFSEMFYARQFRVPVGYAWTGSNNNGSPWTPAVGVIPNDSTQKQGWGMTVDDGGGTGSDLVLGTHINTDTFKNAGNSNALDGAQMAGELKLNDIVVWGEWMGFAGYAKHNSAAPTQGIQQMIAASTLGKTKKLDSVGSVLCARRGFPQFGIFIDGAWFDDNPICRMEAAENYIALGTNASCIVIVGNAARLQDCTKLAFSPPTAWAGQEISARFSSGDLNLSGDLFVYILQANGALLSQYGVPW